MTQRPVSAFAGTDLDRVLTQDATLPRRGGYRLGGVGPLKIACTRALSPRRSSMARPSPISAATTLSRSSGDAVVEPGRIAVGATTLREGLLAGAFVFAAAVLSADRMLYT